MRSFAFAFRSFPAFLLLLSAASPQAQVKLGLGSYGTTGGGDKPAGQVWMTDDCKQPPRTAQWWATLFTSQFSGDLFAHPAAYRASAQGLLVGYPGAAMASATGGDFQAKLTGGVQVGIAGMTADAARVSGYSDFAVTARWQGGGKTLEATFGHGLPFSYYKIAGGNAVVTASGSAWYNKDGTLGITAGGKSYGVFGPTGSAWSGAGAWTSSLAGKDYLSVAVLPDDREETLLFFRKYAYAFVKKTAISWQYQEATARLVSTYAAETEIKEGADNGTLFALMRHHWLEAASPLTGYSFASARGTMKVAAGPSFSTSMQFNGILPAMPDVGRNLDALKRLVAAEKPSPDAADTYYSGKFMARSAELMRLADFAGNAAKRDELLATVKGRLQEWFTSGGAQQFVYYKPWGTLIGYPASFGSDARASDHHFHYGYLIRTAAAIAEWDKQWAAQDAWGGMVEMLIREVNAWDPQDPLFSRFRYFDGYEGHGWADGMGFPERGNNQESSSESMNCNAGIIEWGIATGNRAVRDLGIFMYVNETRAVEQYWWDVDHAVFPAGFNHSSLGMVWGDGGAYATWFSGEPSAIHGINILPITAGQLYLGRKPEHIVKNYAEGAKGGWSDLFTEYLAFSDADKAAGLFGETMAPEEGATTAYGYHHVQSLKAVGRLNTAIGANAPSFAVFDRGQARTYTAFNPGLSPLLVTFTDGYRMEVPAGAQISKAGSVIAIAVRDPARPVLRRRNGTWLQIGPVSGALEGMPAQDMLGRALRPGDPAHGLRFLSVPARGASSATP